MARWADNKYAAACLSSEAEACIFTIFSVQQRRSSTRRARLIQICIPPGGWPMAMAPKIVRRQKICSRKTFDCTPARRLSPAFSFASLKHPREKGPSNARACARTYGQVKHYMI